MKSNIRPLGCRVLLEVIENTRLESGIIIPDNAKEKPQEYKVAALGTALDDTDIRVGDTVLTGIYDGTEIKVDGKLCKLVEFDEILAVVN